MKKLVVSLILCAMLVMMSMSFSFAATTGSFIESPDVKIIIDGTVGQYDQVPIISSGRTLLPLRAVLTNLGVLNDDQHIIWNGTEKSVTIIKDSTKIYLKIGSNTAYINDVPVTIDVPPIIYPSNNATYVPARFIAQSLGKKVVWDGSTKSVLIREESQFNAVKAMLEKSQTAMGSVDRTKLKMDISFSMSSNLISVISMNMNLVSEIDSKNKKMHMKTTTSLLGNEEDSDVYMADGSMYAKDASGEGWQKTVMNKVDYEKSFKSENSMALEINDILCAGLVVDSTSKPGTTILKGDVYLNELFDQVAKGMGSDSSFQLNNAFMEITIDNETNMVSSMIMDIDGNMSIPSVGEIQFEEKVSGGYSDYNGDFEVTVPQDIIDSAVEVASITQ
jgi:hypothetical protein